MASMTAKLDLYKVDANFHGDTVVHTTSVIGGPRTAGPETTWKRTGIIGAGGFGVVWQEKAEGSEQVRAVKVIPKIGLNTQEVKALVKVQDHPRLFVKFLCWFEDRNSIYIAMEYIAYGDLEQYLDQHGPKAAAEAKQITSQILEGLVVLHGREICHRDLKPKNILIACPSPIWVKITDFGISKQAVDTSLRTRAGTICFQAPEQLGLLPKEMKVRGSYTKAVDIWALGTVVHLLLTSEICFLDSYGPDDFMTTMHDSSTNLATDASTDMATIDYDLLYSYCRGFNFPTQSLRRNGVSNDGIDFVKSLMIPDPRKRVSAKDALQSRWLTNTAFEVLRHQFEQISVNLTPESARQLLAEQDRATITQLLGSPSARELWALQCTAVLHGLPDAVKVLLKLLDDVDSLPRPGCATLLQLAVINGQIGAMQVLFDRGADPNACVAGQTPLCLAAAAGGIDAMGLLLAKGAIVELVSKTRDGQVPLHAAAAGGHLGAMELLLDSGADVNGWAGTENGQTALHAAAAGRHLDAIGLLLARGADINGWAATKNGQTALHAAAAGRHLDVLRLLLDSGAIVHAWAGTENGQLALHSASSGHLEGMGLLLDRGGDINGWAGNRNGQTALHAAAGVGNLEAMELLLGRGAIVHAWAGTENGQLALHAAAAGGYLDAIKLLLDSGGDTNGWAGNKNGQTALHAAAVRGQFEAMELLLDRGAIVHAWAATENGQLALHGATASRYLDGMRLLLDRGGDSNGWAANINGQTALHAAAAGGYLEGIRLLLDNGGHINGWAANENGQTALHAAAAGGHLEAVRLLLDRGCDINAWAGTKYGRRALEAAAAGGHLETVRLLLDRGAR